MILILSDSRDSSTTDVIKWLNKYNHDYLLINEFNQISDVFVYKKKNKKSIHLHTTLGQNINFDTINSCWYRRGKFYYKDNFDDLPEDVTKYHQKEWKIINDFLFTELKQKYLIGDFFNSSLNKLSVLCEANNVGLSTPETLITNNRKDLLEYFESKPIINKSIGEIYTQQFENYIYTNRTELVSVNELPQQFFPSKFQTLINKKYELRIFYIDEKFFSAAIFSQSNNKTKVDFRNYDNEVPNHIIPFKLPSNIKNKLCLLMKRLSLNTGSIDMIVTPDNDYIFLEINPVGQFGMVSYPCNFNCEEYIAKLLIKNDRQSKR